MPISPRARLLWPIVFLLGVAVIAVTLLLVAAGLRVSAWPSVSRSTTSSRLDWPQRGQASVSIAGTTIESSGPQRPVPIASLTKIMTALLVLEDAPLAIGAEGFTLEISDADEVDTRRRQARSESVVPVRAGDRLTERQALLALLLPSANNIAHLLAIRTAGSESAFARSMNERAHELGMADTRYVDASGFDPQTVSTARDQTMLARAAMQNPTFAWLVGQATADLPGGGPVRTTNRLLGQGYLGIKTGSTTPAGASSSPSGCGSRAMINSSSARSRASAGGTCSTPRSTPPCTWWTRSPRPEGSVVKTELTIVSRQPSLDACPRTRCTA